MTKMTKQELRNKLNQDVISYLSSGKTVSRCEYTESNLTKSNLHRKNIFKKSSYSSRKKSSVNEDIQH